LDRHVKLVFHGSSVTSDAGRLAYRELDDALSLTAPAGGMLTDGRRDRNTRDKLAKNGARIVAHARYVTFQMAEVTVPRTCSRTF
jgi:radical SAM superfamily enzyme with C-terminal helix-hairpin-helix motif